jgi:hypothetical protein
VRGVSWDISEPWYGVLSWWQAYGESWVPAYGQFFLAGLALFVSWRALRHSRKSALAADRSATAAELSNRHAANSADAADRSATAAEVSIQHAARSADAADASVKITVRVFENEEKRKKAQAYWTLYRIQNLIDAGTFKPALFDLSPIQEFLHVYGHTLDRESRENVRIALNGIEQLVASFSPGDSTEQQQIRQCVTKAALALREDWM